MARKKVDKEITFSDGASRRFRTQQFKTKDAHEVLERLLRIAAPLLGTLATNLGETDAEKAIAGDLSKAAVTEAFNSFAANLMVNEGILDWLAEKARKCTMLETEVEEQFVPLTLDLYDDTFAGEYGAEAQLIASVLQANYASFFAGAGGLAKVARRFVTPRPSASTSPQE